MRPDGVGRGMWGMGWVNSSVEEWWSELTDAAIIPPNNPQVLNALPLPWTVSIAQLGKLN